MKDGYRMAIEEAGPAIDYLRRREWSMGNGQCPECYGLAPGKWATEIAALVDPRQFKPEHEGHRPNCRLAAAIETLCQPVVYATESR